MSVDIEDFNARWLKAWSDKDVPALLDFYAPDTIYADPQTAAGLEGREALGRYLTGLFAATPPMTYTPHEIWATRDGYCGRWFCEVRPEGGPVSYLRGFDLVVLREGLIARNEVFVHALEALPTL